MAPALRKMGRGNETVPKLLLNAGHALMTPTRIKIEPRKAGPTGMLTIAW